MTGTRPGLFCRYEGNPVLTADVWPYTVNAVFNPGATVGPDGETVLVVRVEDRSGLSHLTVARSLDGRSGWTIDAAPTIEPAVTRYEERWGIEDPRITAIGDEYFVAYTGFSAGGPLVCLASTRDFRSFERRAVVSTPEDKDAALFPTLFGGRYALVHRPVSWGLDGQAAHIWLSFSPDLRHWGDHSVILESRRAGRWDREKVGIGPPPISTPAGWLMLFHGAKATAAGTLYRAGLAVLDHDDPTKVLARSDEWVFGPEASYELAGDVPGVVFPSGWVAGGDGTVRMYYGAADTSVGLATAHVDDLVRFTFTHCVCGEEHAGRGCTVGGDGGWGPSLGRMGR